MDAMQEVSRWRVRELFIDDYQSDLCAGCTLRFDPVQRCIRAFCRRRRVVRAEPAGNVPDELLPDPLLSGDNQDQRERTAISHAG